MTPTEAAAALDGNEYRKEGSRELFAAMKAAGLVAAFTASDDLLEFRGAMDEEAGSRALLTPKGLLENRCDEGDRCPYWPQVAKGAVEVRADFDASPFAVIAPFPHETFTIVEDGEPYCRGIVFRLSSLSEVTP